eukprot:PITA_03000
MWVSNLVPIRKKFEEIRLCVDFHNLNCALDKDKYFVPSMEKILQAISRISLNTKKIIFVISEGNPLGHIISKSGIKVDPNTVKSITHIPFPVNKKAMESFLGKINFLHKLISDYAQIVNLIHEIVNKDTFLKWDKREKEVFTCIKQVIVEAPTLYSLDFDKEFFLYTFASNTSLAIVLTEKDE